MTKVIKITFDDSDIQTDNGDVFYHCNQYFITAIELNKVKYE